MRSSERRNTPSNLEETRQQRQDAVEQVLDLLERAEERAAEEPENESRWRRTLNHLWKSLDEAKLRLAEAEILLERQQHANDASAAPAPANPPNPKPAAAAPRRGSASLTVGRLHVDARRRILFRCAINKVKDNRISHMTIEELDIAIDFFQTLHERQHANRENEKLTQFLIKTNINIQEVCSEMRRHRAHLYARKTHV